MGASGAHDLVLDSAHRFDYFVKQLWDTMQALPRYHGTTTFIITTDHGRGSGLVQWKEHGVEQKGSENIWIAVSGPDTAGARRAHARRAGDPGANRGNGGGIRRQGLPGGGRRKAAQSISAVLRAPRRASSK